MKNDKTERQPNIVWLIPDSVRTVETDDGLTRLDFFDKFKKESVQFSRMYSTAPSTTMSILSLLSGIPAVNFSRDYQDIKNYRSELPMIYDQLKKVGYNNYFFSQVFHVREMFHEVFSGMKNVFRTEKEYDDYFTAFQTGETDAVIDNFLTGYRMKAPFCFFCHWIVDGGLLAEPGAFSERVEEIYRSLREAYGLENDIVIIHSDHGYPVYRGEADPEFVWQHDLVMTEESIRVPFFIKYPGSIPGTIRQSASLIDVYPTICDLLKINPGDTPLAGRSLKQQAGKGNDGERFIRCDNRFDTQSKRKTVIIRGDHKLLYDYEKDRYTGYRVDDRSTEKVLGGTAEPEPHFTTLKNYFLEQQEKMTEIRQTISDYNREKKQLKLKESLADNPGEILLIRSVEPVFFRDLYHFVGGALGGGPHVLGNTGDIDDIHMEKAHFIDGRITGDRVADETPDLIDRQFRQLIVPFNSIIYLDLDFYRNIFDVINRLQRQEILLVDRSWSVLQVEDFGAYIAERVKYAAMRKRKEKLKVDTTQKQKEEYFALLKDKESKQRRNSTSGS